MHSSITLRAKDGPQRHIVSVEKNSNEQSMLGNKQEQTLYKETTHDIKKKGFVNREIYAKWMPCGIYVNNLSRMVLF